MLVILSGVAGAGKDTIKKELTKRMENVESLPHLLLDLCVKEM